MAAIASDTPLRLPANQSTKGDFTAGFPALVSAMHSSIYVSRRYAIPAPVVTLSTAAFAAEGARASTKCEIPQMVASPRPRACSTVLYADLPGRTLPSSVVEGAKTGLASMTHIAMHTTSGVYILVATSDPPKKPAHTARVGKSAMIVEYVSC